MGDVQQSAPVVGPAPKPAKRSLSQRMRLVLVLVTGVVALLCLGTAGVVLVLYDEATKIDRGSPDGAVDNYLRAALVQRDDTKIALYSCGGAITIPGIAGLRDEIAGRERDYGVDVVVTWSSLAVEDSTAPRRAVGVDLTIVGSADGQQRSRRTERWSFDVADQDGWRVCGATKVS